ncbi:polynucleotide kinase-phosphatase [Mycoplasmatota bacterium]|nr:polynucleotide kinase-phosphatase [Mycoplasmatota bacterium]
MQIKVPDLSLVVLIGASSSGKTTFSKAHFNSSEVVSSDYCRMILSDDENNQSVNQEAFDLLHTIVDKRLKLGRLTVVDATNIQKSARKKLISIAKNNDCFPVAIVLNLPVALLKERNREREDRQIGQYVIKHHADEVRRSIRHLKQEGFRFIYVIKSLEELELVTIERKKSWNNKKDEKGPFDIIGDVHGCYDELIELLTRLNYKVETDYTKKYGVKITAPENRRLIFLGDLNDRGPKSVETFKLVMTCVEEKIAFFIPGNHEIKLLRKLSGKNVSINHGLDSTLKQLKKETDEFKEKLQIFIDQSVSHYVLDDGKLVVAHAGLPEHYHGRTSGRVRSFSIFGDVTGEKDEEGLPIRNDWTSDYRGDAVVVYGHVPQKKVYQSNNTFCIDTGCVFGGELTALRYPELECVSVLANDIYCDDNVNFKNDQAIRIDKNLIYAKDVLGNKVIYTRLLNQIKLKEENNIAAFETMSRFAINPNWLVYLPPTMSPSETSKDDAYLEYPTEAFNYYFSNGIEEIVCEEKHMGSRAIIVLCKNQATAKEKFNAMNGEIGICYTRTGRNFFNDRSLEQDFLNKVKGILDKTNFWDDFNTDWVVLDNELMPWSIKAQHLIHDQYAPIGLAGKVSLKKANELLEQVKDVQNQYIMNNKNGGASSFDINQLIEKTKERYTKINNYIKAYQNYCWDVVSIDDLKLAPFHILATEGFVHADKNHIWHMKTIEQYFDTKDSIIKRTNYIIVKNNEASIQKGIDWWLDLTKQGGEGMVVKPKEFINYGKKGPLQPAIKCRGKEYLRIIYGPEYDFKENLDTLKKRGLSKKRSMAIKEFSLGLEALKRFVQGEPLYRIHECVFGVLSMESDAVDPRL